MIKLFLCNNTPIPKKLYFLKYIGERVSYCTSYERVLYMNSVSCMKNFGLVLYIPYCTCTCLYVAVVGRVWYHTFTLFPNSLLFSTTNFVFPLNFFWDTSDRPAQIRQSASCRAKNDWWRMALMAWLLIRDMSLPKSPPDKGDAIQHPTQICLAASTPTVARPSTCCK